MEPYLNHFTMTTGHNRKSYISEVEASLYPAILGAVTPAIKNPEPVPFLEDNIFLKVLKEDRFYIATIYIDTALNPKAPDLLPLLTTGGAKDEESKTRLIQLMTETYAIPVERNYPAAPIIIDRIDVIGQSELVHIYRWTGDFARCLAWTLLYPELLETRMLIY
jgi:hypothetical protein